MKIRRTLFNSLLFSTLFFLIVSSSFATTYYVSPTGDDANDGLSEGSPKKDLASIIYAMGLGDTLILLPGSYDLVGFRAWPKDPFKGLMYLNRDGGDANITTTIRGKEGAARPEINVFASDGVSAGSFQFNGIVGLHVEYLQINHGEIGYGSNITYKDIIFQGPNNSYAIHGEHHNTLVEDCQIYDVYGGGDAIGIYITGRNNIIRGNFFKNMGQHAINSNTYSGNPSTDWLIENNYITDTNGHGIGFQNLQNTTVRNNVIVNAGSQAISLGGSAFPNTGAKIIGNTIYNADGFGMYGIFAFNGINDIIFENNIIVHPNPFALNNSSLLEKANMETYTFRNNLWKATSKSTQFMPDNNQVNRFNLADWQAYTASLLEDGLGLEQGSIVADPVVVTPPSTSTDYLNYDGSGVDVRLNASSPAIDHADSKYLYQDIEGDWRPQSNLMDIGADEYQQSTGDSEAPTAPTSLSSVVPTDGTVYNPLYNIARLSWDAATDNVYVVGYKIYRDSVHVGTLGGAVTYDDPGLTAETSYNYHVTAIDAEGNESPASNIITHTVPEEPPANEPPATRFGMSYTETDNTIAATFNPATSSAADGSLIKTFKWDFGDGTTQTVNVDLTGLDPTVDPQPAISSVLHTFPVMGYFPVTLTVTDTYNRKSSVTWNVRFKYETPVTYYVSQDGDDLNDGLSEAEPLQDLANAIYRLYNGCTLVIMDGTYELHDFRAWPNDKYKMQMYLDGNGGDINSHVTIKGKEGVLPKIVAYKNGMTGGIIQFNGIIGLEMSNLSIHGEVGYGTHLYFHDLEIMGPGNAYAFHGQFSNSTIENCYIHDIYGGDDAHGMYITGDDITIRGNFIKNTGISAIHTNTHDGVASKRYLIEDNYITDAGGHGISIFNVQDSIIRNNVIINAMAQSLSIGGGSVVSSNNTFTGNTVYKLNNSGWTGVFISNDSTGLTFQNNIVAHNRPFGFTLSQAPTKSVLSTWTVSNNLYYNTKGDDWVFFVDGGSSWSLSEWQTYTSGTLGAPSIEVNSIEAAPQLVSPPTSDSDYLEPDWSSPINVMPTADSPAVDAGIEIADLTDDIDGENRTISTDIGAYQYTGISPQKPVFKMLDGGDIIILMVSDLNYDNELNLKDIVIALQIASGITVPDTVFPSAAVNGRGEIGIADAIHVLSKMSLE